MHKQMPITRFVPPTRTRSFPMPNRHPVPRSLSTLTTPFNPRSPAMPSPVPVPQSTSSSTTQTHPTRSAMPLSPIVSPSTSSTSHATRPAMQTNNSRVRFSIPLLVDFERSLPTLAPRYASVHSSHPALAPYRTLDELLAKIDERSPETRSDRCALVCTLVDLSQTTREPVFQAVLIHAFRGMLCRIRGEVEGAVDEDFGPRLIAAFLQVIATVNVPPDPLRIGLRLKKKTRKRFFAGHESESEWRDNYAFGEECDSEPDPQTLEEPLLIGVWLKEMKATPDEVELVRTVIDHGGLATLVRQRHGTLTTEQYRRIYARLYARRAALLEELRIRLRPEERSPGRRSPREVRDDAPTRWVEPRSEGASSLAAGGP
jgi:hypothetical protein